MESKSEQATRDRAIWFVRLSTFGGAVGALGLTLLFGNMAQAYFSGVPAPKPVPVPPVVPVAVVPVQKPPTVIQSVVHHPYQGGTRAPVGAAPRPPGAAPAPAGAPAAAPPPPPPPPVCHSTPSKPC
jgi:hypothetical protein